MIKEIVPDKLFIKKEENEVFVKEINDFIINQFDYVEDASCYSKQFYFENNEIINSALKTSKILKIEEINNDDLPTLFKIRDFAYSVISKKFGVDKNTGFIEFWSYYPEGKVCDRMLDFHIDNFGATSYNVSTCIIYTQKDNTIIGGNMLIKSGTIPIEENDILLMDGDFIHRPELVSGYGYRNCVVVQFKN